MSVDLTQISDPNLTPDIQATSPVSAKILENFNTLSKSLQNLNQPSSSSNFWVTVFAHCLVSAVILYAFFNNQYDANSTILALGLNWGIAVKGTLAAK